MVLPSPNGSTLSLLTGDTPTFAGCLRNASAVAHAARAEGLPVGILAAGERWAQDDSLRPALEDLMGAGAIIDALGGTLSPEAQMARAVFRDAQGELLPRLRACVGGRELGDMGFSHDLPWIVDHDASAVVPRLIDGAYVQGDS